MYTYVMMDVDLTILILIIISQYIHIANHYVVHLKLIQHYVSINLDKTRKKNEHILYFVSTRKKRNKEVLVPV